MAWDLRLDRQETVYRTAKESGLRPESINKIESLPVSGSARNLSRYIDSYCQRFPSEAYRLLYRAIENMSQSKKDFAR